MKLTRVSLKALICVVGWEGMVKTQNDVRKKFEKNHELNIMYLCKYKYDFNLDLNIYNIM